MNRWLFPLLMALALLAPAWSSGAQAAQGYDNCTGFITTLPATITGQGVYCLKQNLSTALSSGRAISVEANNITIDCNGFSLVGLDGSGSTTTGGIYASGRSNITVRHCAISGFYYGVFFTGASGGGHIVEDNRFDTNTVYGVDVEGDGSVIRRNLVNNTGPSGNTFFAKALTGRGSVDILDNTVSGLTTVSGSNGYVFGIETYNDPDGRVSGNIVRGLSPDGSGNAVAIVASQSANVTIRDNDLEGNGGYGASCDVGNHDITRDNFMVGFGTAISQCIDGGNNHVSP